MNDLLQALAQSELGDIVTRPERGSVRLPREAELQDLQAPLPAHVVIREHIENWTLLRVALTPAPAEILIYGTKVSNRHLYVTSPVRGLHGRLAVTRSGSVYCLDGQEERKPSIPGVCAALNGLGIGPQLGIPEIWI